MSDHQKTYYEYGTLNDSLPNGIPNTPLNINPGLKLKKEEESTNIVINEDIVINEKEDREQESSLRPKAKSIVFWGEDPNILLKQEYILEFYPSENMTYEQKLNAVTRLVIVITILSYYYTKSVRFLFIGIITLVFIYVLHSYKQNEDNKKKKVVKIDENFDNANVGKIKNIIHKQAQFQQPSPDNPFGNVLNTDIEFHPLRKPAPPAFNENVNKQILEQAKQLVRNSNPDQPDITDKLFKDLGDQYTFEQSMRQFVSNPATTIPNDQGAFSDFCYGTMISCKEDNSDACARNTVRYTNY